MTLGTQATNKDVLDYWHSLQEDYRLSSENDARVCMGTSSYGLQEGSNYWFLGPQVNIQKLISSILTLVYLSCLCKYVVK